MHALLDEQTLADLRDRLHEMQQERTWLDHRAETRAERERTRPQIAALVREFVSASIDVTTLRERFDRETRSAWSCWGIAGLSGAMVLNKLAKHLGGRNDLEQVLREAFAAPSDEDDAVARLEHLLQFLHSRIDAGEVARKDVQPKRVPIFCSIVWHAQDPDRWPIAYQSNRRQLESWGAFAPVRGEPARSYLDFRAAHRDVSTALGIDGFELEGLAFWLAEKASAAGDPGDDEFSGPKRRCWLIAPGRGATAWSEMHRNGEIGIGWPGLGDLATYASRNALAEALGEGGWGKRPTNTAGMCWSFCHEIAVGDVVFVKKGRRTVVGCGVVRSDYFHAPGEDAAYPNRRKVDWVVEGEFAVERLMAMKTVTEITQHHQLLDELCRLSGLEALPPVDPEDAPIVDRDDSPPVVPYDLDAADAETFLDRSELEELLVLLRAKKNLVLQGPPGTGKTYLAMRLAWLLLGERDPGTDFVEVVQFHQAYSYEDFVQGYRPNEGGGFTTRNGPFLRLCDRALQDQDTPYVVIIDEINRGNLAKILGELMLLVEHDKRSPRWAAHLAYASETDAPFHVPPNVYVIGTMNTADRSLALVDYALRRRFVFFDVEPALAGRKFLEHLVRCGVSRSAATSVRDAFVELNTRIADDRRLGRGYGIGHSYLCNPPARSAPGVDVTIEDWLPRVIDREIEPLLREYWFDDPDLVAQCVASLHDTLS